MGPLNERIEHHIDRSPGHGPAGDCWKWKGYRVKPGNYGSIRGDGKGMVLAHRAVYEKYRGPIPKGMLVCHACDVSDCVNPAHLWLGTHKQNTQDMIQKGRGRHQCAATR